MESITKPQVIGKPFCDTGDKNTIPENATGSQLASLEEGFPPITALPIANGGIPPEREDFNGAMNLNSQFYFAFQNGWLPTFDDEVSTAIGGYALGAVLWYAPSTGEYANSVVPVRSLVENNTYNFNLNASYIGTYWGVVGINSRANVDLSNLSSTGEAHFAKPDLSNATVPYVVSRTHSGTTYCTIWSDGYCEQGGRLEYTSGAGFTNVALPVPYADTNYSLMVCLNRNSAANDFRSGYIVDSSNISVGYDYSATIWETKGYIS